MLLAIARQAGVTGTISRATFDDARREIVLFARTILRDALTFVELDRRMTLHFADVEVALARAGVRVLGFRGVFRGSQAPGAPRIGNQTVAELSAAGRFFGGGAAARLRRAL